MTVAKEPDRRGELEENRKTIARGMPGDSGVTVATTCTLFAAAHRRPAFPAPSDERVKENSGKPRAKRAARPRICVCMQRCLKFESTQVHPLRRASRPLQIIIRAFAERDPSQHAAHLKRGAQGSDRRGHCTIEREL